VAWIVLFEKVCGIFAWGDWNEIEFDPFERFNLILFLIILKFRYGTVAALILYILRMSSLLVLPQSIFNFLGLILFNGFKERVTLKASPLLAPLVCFRVVTKGDYPELVKVCT
jgi:egghead protein (zeste-white 4 protein)